MPVHRVPGGQRHGVFAYVSEIDAWMEGYADRVNGPAAAEAGLEGVRDSPGAQVQDSTEQSLPGSPVVRPRFGPDVLGLRRRVGLPVVAALLLAGGTIAVKRILSRHPQDPVRVTFAGSKALAWNEGGKLLWDYDFGSPVLDTTPPPRSGFRAVEIADLRGDGHKEVLLGSRVHIFGGQARSDGLYCLTAGGKLLWRVPFDFKLRFGGQDYAPTWEFYDLLVTGGEDHSKTIWCAAGQSPWWPGILLRLGADGHPVVRFVNSGHIEHLSSVTNSTGSYILAGGINNEYDCAMLAVLRADQPFAVSPQTAGSPFRCDNCQQGHPYRYFLFPRSELSKVAGAAYNEVNLIQVTPNGVEAMTWESDEGAAWDWVMYELSRDFDLRSASFSDSYWERYVRLKSAGGLKQFGGEPSELSRPVAVRVWAESTGWKQVQVPLVPEQRAAD